MVNQSSNPSGGNGGETTQLYPTHNFTTFFIRHTILWLEYWACSLNNSHSTQICKIRNGNCRVDMNITIPASSPQGDGLPVMIFNSFVTGNVVKFTH